MPDKTETITPPIRIPEELKQELDRLAKADGRSFNNLVSLILNKYVKEQKN